MRLNLILMMRDIYINSNLNSLTKFTSISRVDLCIFICLDLYISRFDNCHCFGLCFKELTHMCVNRQFVFERLSSNQYAVFSLGKVSFNICQVYTFFMNQAQLKLFKQISPLIKQILKSLAGIIGKVLQDLKIVFHLVIVFNEYNSI